MYSLCYLFAVIFVVFLVDVHEVNSIAEEGELFDECCKFECQPKRSKSIRTKNEPAKFNQAHKNEPKGQSAKSLFVQNNYQVQNHYQA